MSYERLPEATHTLYAELLDQAIRAEAGARLVGLPPGTFVSKSVGDRIYWYMQRMEAGRKRQVYVGPESPALLEWLEEARRQRADWSADEKRRGEIVSMLAAGGAVGEAASVARVLRLLAEANVFRLGGVLVGTQAFRCYANILGVRFEKGALRTEDVDVAQDPTIAVAVSEDSVPTNVENALRQADPRFFAVPGLDPAQPSTSFKVRGRDLRVDFVTPARGRSSTEPVPLPLLRVAATPLPFLGYLIRGSLQAVVLGARGVLVNVPQPSRFALHKLWTAGRRPVSEQAKARKDLVQAEALIEVLLSDRADDLTLAWQAAVQDDARAAKAIKRIVPKLRLEVSATLARQLGWT